MYDDASRRNITYYETIKAPKAAKLGFFLVSSAFFTRGLKKDGKLSLIKRLQQSCKRPLLIHVLHTVWKNQNFSVIQILREINFGQSRISKTAVFATFGASSFVKLV